MAFSWTDLSINPTPFVGWVAMCVYWAFGIVLGYRYDYFSLLFISPERDAAGLVAVCLAVMVTAWAQLAYRRNAYNAGTDICHAGRPLSLFSLSVLPLMNGLLEPFHFFSWFDLGESWAHAMLPAMAAAYPAIRFVGGFFVFIHCSGASHALLWGGLVFPQPHVPANPVMILRLTAVSACWYVLYARRDIVPIIVLHWAADVVIVESLHIPPPWAPAKIGSAKARAA